MTTEDSTTNESRIVHQIGLTHSLSYRQPLNQEEGSVKSPTKIRGGKELEDLKFLTLSHTDRVVKEILR